MFTWTEKTAKKMVTEIEIYEWTFVRSNSFRNNSKRSLGSLAVTRWWNNELKRDCVSPPPNSTDISRKHVTKLKAYSAAAAASCVTVVARLLRIVQFLLSLACHPCFPHVLGTFSFVCQMYWCVPGKQSKGAAAPPENVSVTSGIVYGLVSSRECNQQFTDSLRCSKCPKVGFSVCSLTLLSGPFFFFEVRPTLQLPLLWAVMCKVQ